MINLLKKRRINRLIRRCAWIASNLFYAHIVPITAGRITKSSVMFVRSRITGGPWLTQGIAFSGAIDGAMGPLRPNGSWAKYALPKGLPSEGSRTLAIENDPHLVDDFDGVIPSGYGKGTKSLLLSDLVIVKIAGKTSVQKINYHVHDADVAGRHFDIVVTGVEPGTKQWELNISRGSLKGRYAFVTTDKGTCLVTRMTDHGVIAPKPNYYLRKAEVLTELNLTKVILERKIDGSLGNAHIQGNRVHFRSHRPEGETYHDRLPSLEFIGNNSSFLISRLLYPGPSLTGTVLQGELVHPDGAARVSGILNSLPANARAIQQQRGVVSFFVWDVLRYKGKDVSSIPYEERRALYERIVKDIRVFNRSWNVVERNDPRRETAEQFYTRITNSPLPYGEGIVIKPCSAEMQKWDKIKMTGFGYFELVDILPGEGKYANSVGRLVVRNPANGATGEVGSLAVPNEFRDWMWSHRDDLLGDIVKVRSQEITARGVPRAGVFYGFHNGEINLLMQAESMAGGDPAKARSLVYAMKTSAGWKKK